MNMDTARVIDLRACVSEFSNKLLHEFDVIVFANRGYEFNRVLLVVRSSTARFTVNGSIADELPLPAVVAPYRVRIVDTSDMVCGRTEMTCNDLSCFSSCDACHLDLDAEPLASHAPLPSVGS